MSGDKFASGYAVMIGRARRCRLELLESQLQLLDLAFDAPAPSGRLPHSAHPGARGRDTEQINSPWASLDDPISPHPFRKCLTTTVAINNPAAITVAPEVLGHQPTINEAWYNMAGSVSAFGQLHDAIEAELRDARAQAAEASARPTRAFFLGLTSNCQRHGSYQKHHHQNEQSRIQPDTISKTGPPRPARAACRVPPGRRLGHATHRNGDPCLGAEESGSREIAIAILFPSSGLNGLLFATEGLPGAGT